MNKKNEIHEYEMSMLTHIVVSPFNGGTDWSTVAAFPSAWEAKDHAALLNREDPEREFPYEVRNVGSLYRAPLD